MVAVAAAHVWRRVRDVLLIWGLFVSNLRTARICLLITTVEARGCEILGLWWSGAGESCWGVFWHVIVDSLLGSWLLGFALWLGSGDGLVWGLRREGGSRGLDWWSQSLGFAA